MHELAREFGVESRVVLAKLRDMGEFVKSASSTVEKSVALTLREAFSSPDNQPVKATTVGLRPPPPLSKRSHSNRLRMRSLDDAFADRDEANMARSLGLRGIPASPGPRKPLTGTAARLRERFPQIRDDDMARLLATRWATAFVDEAEAVAWWDAGLGAEDHSTVGMLKNFGIKPGHLNLVINGRRVGDALRGGSAVSHVAGLLRTHGYIS